LVLGRAPPSIGGLPSGDLPPGSEGCADVRRAGTWKPLGLDPFAYLRELLPALHALGDSPHEEVLADWLPDAWQKRQQINGPPAAVVMPA
jgi:hypothetical protein